MKFISSTEIEEEYGVCSIETAYLMRELGFKQDTIYSYRVRKEDNSSTLERTHQLTGFQRSEYLYFAAPQIHEISPLLPYEFDYKAEGKFYYLTLEYIANKPILSYIGKNDSLFRQSGHLAAQYANMWLRVQDLREEGLISI